MGEEGKGNPEDVDIFRREEAGLLVDIVTGAPEPPADDLLAEELTGEGPETHDVRDRPGVPTLGEHADRDDVLDLLARFTGFPDGIDLLPEIEGYLFFGARSVLLFVVTPGDGQWFVEGLGLFEDF